MTTTVDYYIDRLTFDEHLRHMRETPVLIIDTEGTLNHPHSTTWGLSYSSLDGKHHEYFAFYHEIGQNLPTYWLLDLKEVIEKHPCVVMHNAKHDLRALRNLDIHVSDSFYCTLMMAHFINENWPSKELDWLCKFFELGAKEMPEAAQILIKNWGWNWIPVDLMRSYADNDAVITAALFRTLLPMFQEQGFDGDLWEWEKSFIRLFCKIEDVGVLIDTDLAEQELGVGLNRLNELQDQLGFNPGSTKQLGEFLLGDLGLEVVKRNKPSKTNKLGNPSFDKEAMAEYEILMEAMGDDRATRVLEYRGWQKTTSSNYKPYLELLGHDGRLRASYKLHGTKTGRMSCERPNLQQIPKMSPKPWNGNLKRVFLSPAGYTSWEVDYSQLEFRLSAAYCKIDSLIEIFNDPTRDVFTEMSITLNMTRDQTKTLVYTIMYGGGYKRLMAVFKVSAKKAREILKNFFTAYSGFKKMTDYAADKCWNQRYLTYWTGRRRHFDKPWDQAHKAYNSVIQGGAFEIVKRQMIKADRAGLNNEECYMDLQVHDSVRFTIKNGRESYYLPIIKQIMEDVNEEFGVLFRVEIKKWATKEEWTLAA